MELSTTNFQLPNPGLATNGMENAENNVPPAHEAPLNEASAGVDVESELFKINMGAISCVPKDEQDDELANLGISVYDQTMLEEGVIAQVENAFRKKEEEMKIRQAQKDLPLLKEEIRTVKQRIGQTQKALSMSPKNNLSHDAKRKVEEIKSEKENKMKQLRKLEAKLRSVCLLLGQPAPEAFTTTAEPCDLDQETQFQLEQIFSQQGGDDLLISTGEMTPFGTRLSTGVSKEKTAPKIVASNGQLTDFERFLLEDGKKTSTVPPPAKRVRNDTNDFLPQKKKKEMLTKSPNNLSLYGQPSTSRDFPILKAKRKKIKLGSRHATGIIQKKRSFSSMNENYRSDPEMSDIENGDVNYDENDLKEDASGSEYHPEESSGCESDMKDTKIVLSGNPESDTPWVSVTNGKADSGSNKKSSKKKAGLKRVYDDGNEKVYLKRLREYRLQLITENREEENEDVVEIDGDFKVPAKVWNNLFRYQQTGVRWLWELHQQNCGGIIGDEMGLGKTIQVIAFFAGLQLSCLHTNGDKYQGLGPVVLVCPATVMHQWVKEFHKWWPPVRVAILHLTGSYHGSKESLVRYINRSKGVLVTSYGGLTHYQKLLHSYDWHYVVLDEGHKIRNPNAQVTLACKQFRTPHRVILSGSPIQNNLKELWSLFDFVFPGKLGTLPVFMQQFSVPITHGGYSNATEVQVQTAYKCAVVLRDTIKPYLLRRLKSDVKMSLQLPNKNEQVLFCKLTDEQRDVYKQYLESSEISEIVDGKFKIFVGLINIRKICNHPDIFTGGPKIFTDTDISSLKEEDRYGYFKRSGKMLVIESLLRMWKQQGHRVLLFTQSRQMLVILEAFVSSRNYTYMKMDGTTNIGSRQPAIHKFNTDPSIFLFLLTTRVGGLGVNLTGANRVIIYDPDWNPSTDLQARERAWRIGQEKQVTIYRLLTAGTIEEKIYHRQIFKQFLTNRVLRDPRQRRFFKSNDLHELFTLGTEDGKRTETSAIFAGTGSEIKLKQLEKKAKEKVPKFSFSPEKVEKMKEIAKKLSLKLSKGGADVANVFSETGKAEVKNENSFVQQELSVKADHVVVKKELPGKKKDHTVVKKKLSATRKKKKKRRKGDKKFEGIVFEGETISHLIGQGEFKQSEEQQDDAQQDDYILKKLLKKSGVKSALEHENIVNSADPDYLLVEGEAERVAREAVQALKRSRKMCQKATTGIPNWTGVNRGSAPPPKKRFGTKKNTKLLNPEKVVEMAESSNKPLFGKTKKKMVELESELQEETQPVLSSSQLMEQMRKRNNLVNTKVVQNEDDNESEESASEQLTGSGTEYDEMLCDIRNFVAFQSDINGQASTSEILEAFKDKVPICGTPVFKALLAKICDFHRTTSGDGLWKLKSSFR